MTNIHGYCPSCKVDLDGDLLLDTFTEMYQDKDRAIESCKYYSGYEEYLLGNKWNRAISISNWDAHLSYVCPDCNIEFSTSLPKLEQ